MSDMTKQWDKEPCEICGGRVAQLDDGQFQCEKCDLFFGNKLSVHVKFASLPISENLQ